MVSNILTVSGVSKFVKITEKFFHDFVVSHHFGTDTVLSAHDQYVMEFQPVSTSRVCDGSDDFLTVYDWFQPIRS